MSTSNPPKPRPPTQPVVLIVDSDPDERAAAKRWVERSHPNALVLEARTATEAIEFVQAGGPDLVLTDVFLAGVGTGEDVVAEAQRAGIPVAVVSTHDPGLAPPGVETMPKAVFGESIVLLLARLRFGQKA